ncbi:unnamed protein product [Microthlaspi erraticum]|uniref:Uncharacterized protein n=1 Tax=Microthlaspi erraticum TaxID=1685480 RepID=A0A6D2ILH3_9BRAS|nr:unnamed protein product [Microthlaspi erraticum]
MNMSIAHDFRSHDLPCSIFQNPAAPEAAATLMLATLSFIPANENRGQNGHYHMATSLITISNVDIELIHPFFGDLRRTQSLSLGHPWTGTGEVHQLPHNTNEDEIELTTASDGNLSIAPAEDAVNRDETRLPAFSDANISGMAVQPEVALNLRHGRTVTSGENMDGDQTRLPALSEGNLRRTLSESAVILGHRRRTGTSEEHIQPPENRPTRNADEMKRWTKLVKRFHEVIALLIGFALIFAPVGSVIRKVVKSADKAGKIDYIRIIVSLLRNLEMQLVIPFLVAGLLYALIYSSSSAAFPVTWVLKIDILSIIAGFVTLFTVIWYINWIFCVAGSVVCLIVIVLLLWYQFPRERVVARDVENP